MVIRTKCKDGSERIDWVKTIVSMTILGTIVLLGLNLSIEANARSKETSIEVRALKEQVNKIDAKLDRLIERK